MENSVRTTPQFVVILMVAFLASCTATEQLTKDGHYLEVSPKLDPEHTAQLVSKGFYKCFHNPGITHQLDDRTWLVTFMLAGYASNDALFAVEINNAAVKIAPMGLSTPLRKQTGMIAEWVETGRITTCESTDAHLARWGDIKGLIETPSGLAGS